MSNKQLVLKVDGLFSELTLSLVSSSPPPFTADDLIPHNDDLLHDLSLVFKQLYDGSLLADESMNGSRLNAYTQAIYLVDEALAELTDKEFIGEVLEVARFFHILLPITDAQNWLEE